MRNYDIIKVSTKIFLRYTYARKICIKSYTATFEYLTKGNWWGKANSYAMSKK